MLYNQEETTIYKRSNLIVINNELTGIPPSITFHEQYATVDGVAINGRASMCTQELSTDPDADFALLNPETGEEIGRMTEQAFQVALYSLYINAAQLRDANVNDEGEYGYVDPEGDSA